MPWCPPIDMNAWIGNEWMHETEQYFTVTSMASEMKLWVNTA